MQLVVNLAEGLFAVEGEYTEGYGILFSSKK